MKPSPVMKDSRREHWRRPWAAIVLLAVAMLMATATGAQESVAEQRVKAAFIYKFAGYVDWPSGAFTSPDAPIVFGVLGEETVARELEVLAEGRQVGTHPLQVRTLGPDDPLDGVHVFFIGNSVAGRLADILGATNGSPVLIVTESDRALNLGSVINFVMTDGRVRFEISTASADRRAIKLSSRLLAVAQNVRQGVN
ncbi:YfiR family protein [Tahibacter amnicola]|uniref:YfiR family protein n=1 Tax=Tahibacter amnicola TaxID=2976241 RepID=A0ABY6BN98_9GAMM|nr:YfiR family protein [Tahibacter amnicola]UXI70046.1 YfiR family protein [Tahibacter amnicola]